MGKKLDKKVLFLASWYPSKNNLSLGNFVQKHAEIANTVAHIDVLYAVASNEIQKVDITDEVINTVRTVVVYYPQSKSSLPVVSSFLKKQLYLNALKIGFEQLNQSYDLVHLNAVFPAGIFAQWLKKKYTIPYIATVHWTGFLPHHNVFKELPFYVRSKYRSIFKDANLILPVSDHLGKSLQVLQLVKEYKVINNVVDGDLFYPSLLTKESSSAVRFLHVSSFDDAHKNTSGMLSAFGKLEREFILHIITEGKEKEVWAAIEKFNIPKERCIVESQQTAKEVGQAMREADCFVLFSNYETFSVVLAESWTSGIPVIYTQCGGLTEDQNPVLGTQIQINDELALLKALVEFRNKDYSSKDIVAFAKRFSINELQCIFNSIYL